MLLKKLKFDNNFLKNNNVQFFCLVAVSLLLYLQVFSFDFNLDDYIITDSLAGKVNHISDLWQLFKLSYNHTDYRPIVFFSFGLEQLFFGEIIPKYSHLVNLFLFVLIAWSALRFFYLLFEDSANLLFFFAVLLFCVHPLNTEVVCSLKCRDNLLSMLLGLNSTIFFIQFVQDKSYKWLRFLLFILSTMIALFSKADAVGFLLFNVAYIVFFKKETKLKFIVLTILSIAVIGILLSALRNDLLFSNTSEVLKGQVTFTENPLAVNFILLKRIISFINTVSFYFVKLIPITGFKYYYGFRQLDILSVTSFSFYLGILIIITLVLLLVFAIKNENKIFILSISGVFLSSIYALNFFTPVAGIIADRYVFIANLFFCLLLVYLLQFVLIYFQKSIYFNSIFLCLFLGFSALTILRIPAWKDFKTLVDTDAPQLNNSYEAMRIAAGVYYQEYDKGKDDSKRKEYLEKAIFYAEKGILVYPKNSLLYLFIGQYYFKNNEPLKAILAFKNSIQNDTSKTVDPFVFIGDSYYHIHSVDSALLYYKKALLIAPTSPVLINNISTIYYDQNEKEKCLNFNLDLIKKDSTVFAAHENLGYYYLYQNDSSTAIAYFKRAVKFGLDPNSLPIKIK